MKQLQQLRDWITKSNALVQVVLDAQGAVAECRVRQALAAKDSDARGVERHKAEYAYAQRQLGLALAMLFDATGRASIEEATEMLTDVRVGVTAAYELHEAWRKVLFLIDIMHSTDGFARDATDLTVVEAQQKAAQLEREYRHAVAATVLLVPGDSDLAQLACNGGG